MKKLACTLLIATITFGAVSAQDKQPVKTVQKGYYSMKNKATELPSNKKPVSETAISRKAPEVKKGYYSIGRNNEKLPTPTTIVVIGDVSPVRKGYYSIQ
ncbi:MAG: hypothetical protein JNK20_03430 [Flavipsychrobacter sp.]|jgi:hypothetical protein|nr:hypothetical protein [Flavipsychrobacter sp.]